MRRVILFLLFAVLGCSSSDDPAPVNIPPINLVYYNPPARLYGTWGIGSPNNLQEMFIFKAGNFCEYGNTANYYCWNEKVLQLRSTGSTVTTNEVTTATSYEAIMYDDGERLSHKFTENEDGTLSWRAYTLHRKTD